MRGLILVLLLSSTLVYAADHVEVRDLSLDVDGIDSLNIVTGSGPMRVTGDPAADRIVAKATITVPGATAEEAVERIERRVEFSLQRSGNAADLTSVTENGFFGWGNDLSVELDVIVPLALAVVIDDGSGDAEISGVGGPLTIDDGSGSILVTDAGSDVVIEDGSGGIEVVVAGGDVNVVDGSGSIRIERVAGSVQVDDGSGSITVSEIAADFVVVSDGSGGVDYRDVQGRVEIDE